MKNFKRFAVLILSLSVVTICTAITQNQILQLLELNSMFDVLHKNYDNQINLKWFTQKHNMKVINAQFLSRYGFSVQEVKDKEAEVLEAIEARGVEINNPNSECLNTTRSALANAIEYANMNFAGTVGEILYYFDEISSEFFYPVVEVLHMQSNEIQWEVLHALQHVNPVSDMDRLIQRLRDDYYVIVWLYENAIENMNVEIQRVQQNYNRVRSSIFPTFRNVAAYFNFNANMLIDTLPGCTA
ncbi:hypothetical protein PVAND_001432 [Polypedilum vanderplanki]|uniref:Uncharacterized protein n=1 Tax=Polypedilum vanderplanki TaxID=319348 RepID=A0A9J6BNF7_POLVA|nr:hypothetical protein PVAND_001432 [Polypedilum vanderplanki]